jgi:acetyl-CoA C-acetyltransferase
MGQCAELTAKEFKITRKEQDDFALESYKRTKEATEKGLFKTEIISVSITDKKGTTYFNEDEEYKNLDVSKFLSLKPAFEKDGKLN